MPAAGALIGKFFGLSTSLSVGLILLSCCPGGTASNVVMFMISVAYMFSFNVVVLDVPQLLIY